MDKPNEHELPEFPADRNRDSEPGFPLPEGGGQAPAEAGGTLYDSGTIDVNGYAIDWGAIDTETAWMIDLRSTPIACDSLPIEGEIALVCQDSTAAGRDGSPDSYFPGPCSFLRRIPSTAARRRIRGLVGKVWKRLNSKGKACLREFLKSLANEYEGERP